jgi:hypothetical protein
MPELSVSIEALLRVRESMQVERKAQDRTLAARSRADEVARRFMTVPSFGPVTCVQGHDRGNRSFAETSPNGGVAPKPDIGLDTIALPLDPDSETLPKTR